MPFDEYARHDGLGLAELIRSKQVSAEEVLEAAVTRIERHDSRINSVIDKLYDRARDALTRRDPDAPFSGVPFLLKDNIMLQDAGMSLGSMILRDFVAPETHELVRRFEAAGLNVLGRTSMSELGLLPTSESSRWGITDNPWKTGWSAGGSSGGSAAAVAARLTPLAHGADGGGSIRIPASCCGLFGLKPSRGRNPGHWMDEQNGIQVDHCLSISVRDSAALLDATHGSVPGDRWHAPAPPMRYLDAVGKDPAPMRVAFTTRDFCGREVHPECRDAVQSTARLLESLGHQVEEATPPINGEEFNEAFLVMWAAVPGFLMRKVQEEMQHRLPGPAARLADSKLVVQLLARAASLGTGHPPIEKSTRLIGRLGKHHRHADVWIAMEQMTHAAHQLGQFLTGHDVLLTPVLGEPTWPTGSIDFREPIDKLKDRVLRYVGFTPICNTSGFPAMSVPLQHDSRGLPLGSHVIGRFGEEHRLLALAAQLERAEPWAGRVPEDFGF